MTAIANATKERLEAGALVVGMGLRLARTADIGKLAAVSDQDFLFIDLEHSALSLETAAEISAAALDTGCTPLVRASSHAAFHISRPLDGGAQGIVVPHVETAAEARAVVDAALFPPRGHRSVAGGAPQLGYAAVPMAEATEMLNAQTLVVVMLESPTAIENADAIAAVDGVDALLIGTNDLCAEMGRPGDYMHDDVVAAYEQTVAACRKHGKHAGMGGIYDERAERYIAMGVRMVLGGSDVGYLMAGAKARSAFLRGLV